MRTRPAYASGMADDMIAVMAVASLFVVAIRASECTAGESFGVMGNMRRSTFDVDSAYEVLPFTSLKVRCSALGSDYMHSINGGRPPRLTRRHVHEPAS